MKKIVLKMVVFYFIISIIIGTFGVVNAQFEDPLVNYNVINNVTNNDNDRNDFDVSRHEIDKNKYYTKVSYGDSAIYEITEKVRINDGYILDVFENVDDVFLNIIVAIMFFSIVIIFILLLKFVVQEFKHRKRIEKALKDNNIEEYNTYIEKKDNAVKKFVKIIWCFIIYKLIIYFVILAFSPTYSDGTKGIFYYSLGAKLVSFKSIIVGWVLILQVIILFIFFVKALIMLIKEIKVLIDIDNKKYDIEKNKKSIKLSILVFALSIIAICVMVFSPRLAKTYETTQNPELTQIGINEEK